ncbi:MAG: hypothetical protein KC635_26590 [Myxococcales bacterium]|nr:hypothetical protein [Myxococcales bacterium]MCB9735787.1 hypothetical protein [Deltaproteobacteria bacterium]
MVLRRSGERRVPASTKRGFLGRVVRLFAAAGFGFIRGPGGALAYFDHGSLVGVHITGLAVGMRVRFELAAGGVPRAVFVAAA